MTTIIDNNTEHIILNVYEPLLNIIEIFGQKEKIDSLIKDKLKLTITYFLILIIIFSFLNIFL